MKKIILTAILTIFAGSAVAQSGPPTVTQQLRLELGNIGASEAFEGALFVQRADGGAFPDCSVASTQVFAGVNDQTTSGGIRAMYAAMLTAKASGTEVTLSYGPDASGICRLVFVTYH